MKNHNNNIDDDNNENNNIKYSLENSPKVNVLKHYENGSNIAYVLGYFLHYTNILITIFEISMRYAGEWCMSL